MTSVCKKWRGGSGLASETKPSPLLKNPVCIWRWQHLRSLQTWGMQWLQWAVLGSYKMTRLSHLHQDSDNVLYNSTLSLRHCVYMYHTLLRVQVRAWTWKNDYTVTCTKHPHWTKQHACPKQTPHTALEVAGVTCEVTSKRTCHAGFAYIHTRGAFMESMASREDGLTSLYTCYPPILTHAENTLSPYPTGSLIQSPTYMVRPI